MQNEAMIFLDQTSIICCRPGKNSHQLVCVTSLQTNYCKDLQVARCTRLCESLVWVQTYLMNFSSKVQVAHTFFWHDCYLLFKLYCIIMHEWVIVVQRQLSNFSAIPWWEQVNFQWEEDDDDDEVHFVLDQHAELDFCSASSLKQQSVCRHVSPLRHIILILSQPVFALTPWCCGEATNTNFIVFGLTRLRCEPTIHTYTHMHVNHVNLIHAIIILLSFHTNIMCKMFFKFSSRICSRVLAAHNLLVRRRCIISSFSIRKFSDKTYVPLISIVVNAVWNFKSVAHSMLCNMLHLITCLSHAFCFKLLALMI